MNENEEGFPKVAKDRRMFGDGAHGGI